MVRQYAQHIECWLGGQCVLQRPRATHRDGQRLRETSTTGTSWPRSSASPARSPGGCCATRCSRARCTVLVLAADGHEAQLADELEQLIEVDQLPDLNALSALLAPPRRELPDVAVELPTLADYDELIEVTR
jgi:hypothetical protein